MNLSIYLAIFGILVSLLFGAWGISLAIRRRYPGEITFVRELSIGLFGSIVKDLPDMAVLYKGTPVSPDVVLLKGSLVNTGRKDISNSMVEAPVTLSLHGSKWLSANVISGSPSVVASLDISKPDELVFHTGLLRCNEFIRFQALVAVERVKGLSPGSVADSLNFLLKFGHRIEDTGQIRTTDLRPTKPLGRSMAIYLGALVAGIILMVVVVGNLFGVENRFAYDLQIGNDQVKRVTIRRMLNDSVKVKSQDGSINGTMGMEEFFSKCVGRPVVVGRDRAELVQMLAPIFVFYLLVPLLVISSKLRQYWIDKRLRRLLALT